MKVSDYIWDFLIEKGIDTVFMVSGGASAHLMDSLNKRRDKIKIVCCYHEQACAMAADGYYRIAKKPAAVLVTNGPGSTNTITGVLGAYQDSIPMFVMSGQVPTHQLNPGQNNELIELRQLGVQECNIIHIVKNITKFAHLISKNDDIKSYLERSWWEMMEGRMGPIWLDIPLDIQNSIIDEKEKTAWGIKKTGGKVDKIVSKVVEALKAAERPLIIAGNGLHLSKMEEEFRQFYLSNDIPIVTTWNAKDLIPHGDPLNAGSFGLMGERSGNFAIQNTDCLLVLGSRLSIPCMGYDPEKFAPKAKYKFIVDIDNNELMKPSTRTYNHILATLEDFMPELNKQLSGYKSNSWWKKTDEWKQKYPIYKPEYANETNGINSFHFIETLSEYLENNKDFADNCVIVTDMGTSFTCTMQAMRLPGWKTRLFTSSGTCAMGYGLPGAIGAWFADPTKNIILIAGDGGFQMNIQELQTIVHYKIPIKIFILNNNGYSAISLMQDNLFNGEYIGSNNKDISSPDFAEISKAYFRQSKEQYYAETILMLNFNLHYFLNEKFACLFEIKIPENQPLYPRVQSQKREDGTIISNSLENMYPYLSDEEMKKIMF